MSEAAAAASVPSTPSAPSSDGGGSRVTSLADKLVSNIPDDFDLSVESDTPEDIPETSLTEEDFTGDDDDEGSEDTKPETPSKKPPPATPKEPPAPEPKAKSPLPLDRGTEDKPYSINDLPADRFVKVKVDGQEQTVPMRELADGYIRKRTFDSTLSKAKDTMAKAETIAKEAHQRFQTLQQNAAEFLKSDERIFTYLLNSDPDLMLRLGSRIGAQYGEWQKDPNALAQHNYQRQQREIETERQRVAREREEWQETQRRQQAAEQSRKTLEPLYREAMKEAGFPKPTPKFQRLVKALVSAAERDGNGKVTREEFIECFKEAARMSGAETVAQRTPEAPPAPAQRAPKPVAKAGKKDWDSMSHAARMRDPDWLLRKR